MVRVRGRGLNGSDGLNMQKTRQHIRRCRMTSMKLRLRHRDQDAALRVFGVSQDNSEKRPPTSPQSIQASQKYGNAVIGSRFRRVVF
jgi:hypothetical protein